MYIMNKIMLFAALVAVCNVHREILWQVWQPPSSLGIKVDAKWWVDMYANGWKNTGDK